MIWIGGFGWGPGLTGLIITAVMFAVNAFGLYLVVRQLRRRRDTDGGPLWPRQDPGTDDDHGDALQILERRYARGEIDREEFLRRRDDLLSR